MSAALGGLSQPPGDDELLQMSLAEGREQVDALAAAVLLLERAADDAAAVAEAFRAAHSLKGMAASMRFWPIVTVMHEAEAVLQAVREHRLELDAGRASLLLAASDAVGLMIDAIAASGSCDDAATAAGELASELRGALGAAAPASPVDAVPEARAPASAAACDESPAAGVPMGGPGTGSGPPSAASMPLHDVRVAISGRSLMPGARACAVLLALEARGSIVETDPAREQLEQGRFAGRSFQVTVASRHGDAELRRALEMPEVEVVDVRAVERARVVRVDASRIGAVAAGVDRVASYGAELVSLAASSGDDRLIEAAGRLHAAITELYHDARGLQSCRLEVIFAQLPRVVRDLAMSLGRSVRCEVLGGELEVDRAVVEAVRDPLLHLVRNAVDHGIEPPGRRQAAGRDAEGLVSVHARIDGGRLVVEVADDGPGMAPSAMREAAVRRGLLSPQDAATLDDAAAQALCFSPGFSTRTDAGEVSGRGVGLDAVREAAAALGGNVTVRSGREGTTMVLAVPLRVNRRAPSRAVEAANDRGTPGSGHDSGQHVRSSAPARDAA